MKATIFFVSVFLLSNISFAATSTATTSTAKIEEKKEKKLSAVLLIDTSTTLQEGAANSQGQGLSQAGTYRIDASYKLPKDLSFAVRASYSKEYSYVREDGREGDFDDSRLSLSKSLKEIAKNLDLSSAIRLNLPTSRESQLAGYHSGLAFDAGISYKIKKLTLGFTPRFTQNFHSVEVQDNGKMNNSHSILLMLDSSYAFTEKLALSASFWTSRGFTYKGNFSDTYITVYDLGYAWSENFTTSIGLVNKAAALKDTGRDPNYTLYDPYQHVAYFDIVISI